MQLGEIKKQREPAGVRRLERTPRDRFGTVLLCLEGRERAIVEVQICAATRQLVTVLAKGKRSHWRYHQ